MDPSARWRLILEDGAVFEGEPFGHEAPAAGEVVFTTGMVGYPESLTDPSYRGQILVFTYPLIGNYGVPDRREDASGLPVGFESDRIQVSGVIVAEHAREPSHHSARASLDEWLRRENVPGLSEVDTRALTKRLRAHGTMLGKIARDAAEVPFFDPYSVDLVAAVSAREPSVLGALGESGGTSRPSVVLVDCGCKASIARSLVSRGLDVQRVPYDHYFANRPFDGVVISNGPGDPKMCPAVVRNVERALAVGKPILGICLGNQILALAVGAETYKLKFGHRGQNQPCRVTLAPGTGGGPSVPGRPPCVITSQNHGFAVRPESLPDDWQVWFTNANDGTVEGIRHRSKPFYGVQFHPEAHPGPTDTEWVFDDFAQEVKRRQC